MEARGQKRKQSNSWFHCVTDYARFTYVTYALECMIIFKTKIVISCTNALITKRKEPETSGKNGLTFMNRRGSRFFSLELFHTRK